MVNIETSESFFLLFLLHSFTRVRGIPKINIQEAVGFQFNSPKWYFYTNVSHFSVYTQRSGFKFRASTKAILPPSVSPRSLDPSTKFPYIFPSEDWWSYLANICVIWGIISEEGDPWSPNDVSGIIMKYHPLLSVKYAPADLRRLHTILITPKNFKITSISSPMIKSSECWVWAELWNNYAESEWITRDQWVVSAQCGQCQEMFVSVSLLLPSQTQQRTSATHCSAGLDKFHTAVVQVLSSKSQI